jgi:sigma-B regulation protein RsbU (phosphoserine phosphatase)
MEAADPVGGLSCQKQDGRITPSSGGPELFARPENIYQAMIGAIAAARAFQDWDHKARPPQGMDLKDWLAVEAELSQVRDLAQRLEGSKVKLLEAVRQCMQKEEALRLNEETLKASEALYHALVDNLPVRVLHKDPQGRFIFCNQALCAALKRPREKIIGKTDRDFYPEALAEKYIHDDRRVMETGEVFEAIEEHQDPNGERTYVQLLKAPLVDSRGAIIGLQCLYWDITARKQAEAELARTAAEFRVARRIQQRLFPTGVPQVAGLEIGVSRFGIEVGGASFPAEAIGGDYYDFIPLQDGSLGVAIGDVSGHGVGPALLMAETRAFLRAFAQTHTDVSVILGLVNRVLISDIEGDRFITLILAKLDPKKHTLVYASAGHQTGYVLNSAGVVKQSLTSTGYPLGILKEAEFPASAKITLEPGDLVMLVTDGIVEARAPDGSVFGAQRPVDIARVYREATAGQIVDNLYYAVRAFSQNLPQFDDITAAVIKVGRKESDPS